MPRALFDTHDVAPFKLSRTKLELFIDCPRCFYLDRVAGVSRPDFPAFTLNSAVDHLLKKEFDIHRAAGTAHPLLANYGLKLKPFQHASLDKWRHNFTGVQHHHKATNFLVFGAVDDIWVDEADVLYVVDYKATAKDTDPNLDGPWQQAYKRQMEVYQWLLRQNGFTVSDTGYFVYVNGRRDREAFDAKLEFNVHLISYTGNSTWVEPALARAKRCLEGGVPAPSEHCEYCGYRARAAAAGGEVC